MGARVHWDARRKKWFVRVYDWVGSTDSTVTRRRRISLPSERQPTGKCQLMMTKRSHHKPNGKSSAKR